MKYIIIFVLLTTCTLAQNRLKNVPMTRSTVSTRAFHEDVVSDYKHFYSKQTVNNSLFWISLGALCANTEIDHNFSNWYQSSVRSHNIDRFSGKVKHFGEGSETLPILLGASILGYYAMDYNIDGDGYMYNWGTKSIRTMFVGAPVLLATQLLTGGGRSTDGDKSYWRPFKDNNGVSGHAFMGAVPFLTAAHMTEDPLLKGFYYFGSTLTAWSRVNDDDHYLSQAILGWSLAYVSSLAVFDKKSPIQFGIIADGKRVGLSFSARF